MNCKQFNSIGLEEVLAALGHLPTRQNEKEAWYLSPFGPESEASLKVDRPNNVWYLFSEGIGGTTTDFMRKYLNTSVKGVLEWAAQQGFSSFQPQIKAPEPHSTYYIDRIMDIQSPNLIEYLHERGLSAKVYPLIKEIWFTTGDKKLYAIGFKNRLDGWELRNAFYKGALNKKDISVISFPLQSLATTGEKQNLTVAVFEGFMDMLSFVQMQKAFKGNLLVLNSTALLKRAIEELTKYPTINLFLDNDNAGRKCRDTILEAFPNAQDFSHIYSAHKDLNQYLMEKRERHALPAPKAGNSQQPKRGCAEQQDEYREETNRIKKGVRRRM